MKVIRTRMVVVLASSAVLASGFGLTAVAVSSAGQAATTVAGGQTGISPCPYLTVIEYCTQK